MLVILFGALSRAGIHNLLSTGQMWPAEVSNLALNAQNCVYLFAKIPFKWLTACQCWPLEIGPPSDLSCVVCTPDLERSCVPYVDNPCSRLKNQLDIKHCDFMWNFVICIVTLLTKQRNNLVKWKKIKDDFKIILNFDAKLRWCF